VRLEDGNVLRLKRYRPKAEHYNGAFCYFIDEIKHWEEYNHLFINEENNERVGFHHAYDKLQVGKSPPGGFIGEENHFSSAYGFIVEKNGDMIVTKAYGQIDRIDDQWQ